MEQPGDKKLLERYASGKSQAAFATLVKRHIGLVYSTCYRELRHREMAEEATQAVFIALAGKARTIYSEAALVPWLYSTALRQASHIRLQEGRRMARENRAAEEVMRRREGQESGAWRAIEPELNEAICALSYADRQAILLRFFEGMSLREVGMAMGINEDAAQKRVARALEKLRGALTSRKAATISAVALAALLTSHATYAVPAHLPASVAQSAGAMPASQPFRPLNPLIGKGLILVSTTKISIGSAAAVILLLVLVFVIGRHGQSARPATVTWKAGQTADAATQQAVQQMQTDLDQDESAYEANDFQKLEAAMVPGTRTYEKAKEAERQAQLGDPPHPIPPFRMTITSCVISGNTASVNGDLVMASGQHHGIHPMFENIGGKWLIAKFP